MIQHIPRKLPLCPEVVPLELAGKWIAWSADGLKILGHGDTIPEARESAGDAPELVIAWTPPANKLRPVMIPPPKGANS